MLSIEMGDEALRQQVCQANRDLVAAGLVTLSFGNASGLDRERGVFHIKPSGVPYESLRPDDLVAVSVVDGRIMAGTLRPSSDTPTHLRLYQRFPSIGGVVHTHSPFATAWAQAGLEIPCMGTTHADHFDGPVPVTRALTSAEIDGDYEAETGTVVVEAIEARGGEPLHMPAALVRWHGPFTWGADAAEAVVNAVALEAVAAMAHRALILRPEAPSIDPALLRKHFRRKHGPAAYYGQSGPRPPQGR